MIRSALYPLGYCIARFACEVRNTGLFMDNLSDDYRLVRSNRRTLGIEITPQAGVIIRAPKRMPLWSIQDILKRKRVWIEQKRQFIRQRCPPSSDKKFVPGERFLYLGQEYPLIVNNASTVPFLFDGSSFILSPIGIMRARTRFIAWYIQQARTLLLQRTEYFSPVLGVTYNRIKITGARKRLGSCNAEGNMTFSWRLMLAPMKVVDYLVVHELSHLKELNHSQKFWETVARVLPDCRETRLWLRRNHYTVSWSW